MSDKLIKDAAKPYGVEAGQIYKDNDIRMGGRKVVVVKVEYNEKATGRFHADTFYASCQTERRQIVKIACRNLVSYKWALLPVPSCFVPKEIPTAADLDKAPLTDRMAAAFKPAEVA